MAQRQWALTQPSFNPVLIVYLNVYSLNHNFNVIGYFQLWRNLLPISNSREGEKNNQTLLKVDEGYFLDSNNHVFKISAWCNAKVTKSMLSHC